MPRSAWRRPRSIPTLQSARRSGLTGTSIVNLFSWPSRFWSLGSTVNYTLLDFGKRRGTHAQQAQATYDGAVAAYRQNVLTAFQSVEDNLSTLRVLEQESKQQAAAVTASTKAIAGAGDQSIPGRHHRLSSGHHGAGHRFVE